MLSEFPTGPIDLKPEQARDAETTAELVVGHVIEWLRRYSDDGSAGWPPILPIIDNLKV
jgi:hypothetical protein